MIYALRMFTAAIWVSYVAGLTFLFSLLHPFQSRNALFFSRRAPFLNRFILGLDVEVRNRDGLDKVDQAIYISNHQHNLDAFLFCPLVNERTLLIGKKSLKWIPFFGWAFWFAGYILLDRKNKVLAHGTMDAVESRLVNDKQSLWVFPEGTRSKGKGLGRFKKGPFRIALNTGVPLVPVVANSFYETLDFGALRSAKVVIEVLDPISVEGRSLEDIEQIMESTRFIMQDKINELDRNQGSL